MLTGAAAYVWHLAVPALLLRLPSKLGCCLSELLRVKTFAPSTIKSTNYWDCKRSNIRRTRFVVSSLSSLVIHIHIRKRFAFKDSRANCTIWSTDRVTSCSEHIFVCQLCTPETCRHICESAYVRCKVFYLNIIRTRRYSKHRSDPIWWCGFNLYYVVALKCRHWRRRSRQQCSTGRHGVL